MCVATLHWAALSLSCSGLCVCSHAVHGCPQPAGLSLAHRDPCVPSHSAWGSLGLGPECVFPPYLGSQLVHFL